MSKIEFKEFVKKNPQLIKYVESGGSSWQKLYEIYDLYGENNEVWNKYQINSSSDDRSSNTNTNTSNNNNNSFNFGNNFKDLLNMVKGVDLTTVQRGLNSLDKAIEAFKGIIPEKGTTDALKNNYEPRPTYKYFED